jgi:two-component system NarL family sensor kinase
LLQFSIDRFDQLLDEHIKIPDQEFCPDTPYSGYLFIYFIYDRIFMYQNQEIYIVTIIGIILGLLLVSFIVAMMFLYKRRQLQQEQEVEKMKDRYEKEVLRSQLEIQENTFKTISQELHDNIGQMLSVVKLSLSALPLEKDHQAQDLVKHSQEVLNKAIVDLSDLNKSLHPDRITEIGLAESIRFELAAIKKAGLLKVQFSVAGKEFTLPEEKAIFLFRIFQEILNNVLKHSKGTTISVVISFDLDNALVMEVEDNGVGFATDGKGSPLSFSKGVGLTSLFNRAKLIGADINMNSVINEGTRVTVKMVQPPHLH